MPGLPLPTRTRVTLPSVDSAQRVHTTGSGPRHHAPPRASSLDNALGLRPPWKHKKMISSTYKGSSTPTCDASSDDFQGDFSSQFVVATKLSVMNGGARKSLQDINSKFFPDTRKDAFIKSMCDVGMGQTNTANALRDLESIVYSIGGAPLEDGGIAAYGEQIGFSTEFNAWNLAPHIINHSVSGHQAFRHRRSSMSSSTSRSGGDASRKVQLLTSLAILATFSEKGPACAARSMTSAAALMP